MTQQHEPQGPAASSSVEPGRASTDFRASMSGLDDSSIMGAELVVAIVVWTGIGWLLDGWLGTGPVLMIIGAFVGNFAGLYLIWLRSGRMDAAERRAAAARRRPRVVSSPVAAVVDAVVAGRTGIPTSAHTHDADADLDLDADADPDHDTGARRSGAVADAPGGRRLER